MFNIVKKIIYNVLNYIHRKKHKNITIDLEFELFDNLERTLECVLGLG